MNDVDVPGPADDPSSPGQTDSPESARPTLGAAANEESRPSPEMYASPKTKGIVLTHGSMCYGLVDAVRKIAGAPGESLTALSNEGRGPEELLEAVREISGDDPTIIFTDLQTGSCAHVARFACEDPSGTRVVFGTNLPMLLDFVFHRHLPLDALKDRLIESGRHAIRSLDTEAAERGNPSVSGG